jgi:DUF971 family protein
MNSGPAWPLEIRLKEKGTKLTVSFDTGAAFAFTSEFLRVLSPSAEVKGHGPGEEVTVPGKRNVRITRLEPVGNYAVRIIFDDSHSTGLYTWAYLHELGENHDIRWSDYLARLKARGLSR